MQWLKRNAAGIYSREAVNVSSMLPMTAALVTVYSRICLGASHFVYPNGLTRRKAGCS
jgi:hypothetical protein